MDDQKASHHDPFETPFDGPDDTTSEQEVWEQWESECNEGKSNGQDHNSDPNPLASSPNAMNSPRTHDQEPVLSSRPHHTDFGSTGPSATTTALPAQAPTPNSVQIPLRLKSRARQKAQNNNAGIRLVTDMAKLRKLQQQQSGKRQQSVTGARARMGRFVDAAALRALEGKPSDISIGNWNWLRFKTSSNNAMSPQKNNSSDSRNTGDSTSITANAQDLSPNDGPIVIGISLPQDDIVGKTLTPQTATVETPVDISRYLSSKGAAQQRRGVIGQLNQPTLGWTPNMGQPLSPTPQLQSVWSPDTEDGSSLSAGTSKVRTASSISSQLNYEVVQGEVPPAPTVMSTYQSTGSGESMLPYRSIRSLAGIGSVRPDEIDGNDEDNDDDYGTPITLFEEDGSPQLYCRLSRAGGHAQYASATVSKTQSGWWDHVRTPFSEHPTSPFSALIASPMTPAAKRGPLPTSPAADPMLLVVPNEPSAPVLPAATMTSAVSTDAAEWWENSGSDKPQSGTTAAARDRAGLSISTDMANTFHVRVTDDRPPTTASPSRSGMSTQNTVAPRVVPVGELAEKTVEVRCRGLESAAGTPSGAPPPYEAPSRPEMAVRYRAVLPPGQVWRGNVSPSPGPISPGLLYTMTSQGAIHMSDVPLTPPGIRNAAAASGTPLPDQPRGAFFFRGRAGRAQPAAATKTERTRQRHEKEDAVARQAGSLWRGRGCLPKNGCFGRRRGREARKRRRVFFGVAVGVILAIAFAVALAVTLTRHKPASTPYSFWLNTTDFPPIPTGITTVVGAENTINVDGCVNPSTMWSCLLPKELQNANLPFSADELMFVMDIQFDSSSQQLWNVTDGPVPTPTTALSRRSTAASAEKTTTSITAKTTATVAATTTATATSQSFDSGFTPQPSPPAFQEMWFLGNTTDNIVSDRKAGEPTPFYISFLKSVNSSMAGPNEVVRRRGMMGRGSTSSSRAFSFPAAATNVDGTGAAAVLRPFPVQQPIRLYDRGLSTEHYGFYTYYDKMIYVKTITPDEAGDDDDEDGGALETEAAYVVTFLQTRFLVQIWTRMGNSTQMLGSSNSGTAKATNTTQPGTFPYPITITEDLHGGNFDTKGAFARAVDSEQHILAANVSLIVANLEVGGTLINHDDNQSFGGSDGGSGGCKCVWANFIGTDGNTTP